MFSILAKIFIKDYRNYSNQDVRRKYGILSGGFGIFLNLVLFGMKFAVGIFTSSLAVMADAMNNLSDAGSSIITCIGFCLAGRKADKDHPFGHGRYEYISGLFVSFLIVLMSFELFRNGISSVMNPAKIKMSSFAIMILVFSIFVKAYMYFFNHITGKKIKSPAMEATAADSLGDTVSTFVVLVSGFVSMFNLTSLPVDGIAGIIVSIFIFKSGLEAMGETIKPLLGTVPEKEFIEDVRDTVMAHALVSGIHDLVVHDYGLGRKMIILHAEVPGDVDIFKLHDEIDLIEAELENKFNCTAVIHMDPVDLKSPVVKEMCGLLHDAAEKIFPGMTVHDIRVVPGITHTNIVFDAVKPYECKIADCEILEKFCSMVKEVHSDYCCVVKIECPYV